MPVNSYEQFFTQRPLDTVEYTTLEFYHPDLGIRRYVTGQQFEKQLQLEPSAPRDSGLVVTFEPVAFDAPEPEQGEDADSSLNIAVGSVGQMVKEMLKQITEAGERQPFEIIWRKHLSSINDPVRVIKYEIANTVMIGLRTQFEARQTNPASRRIALIRTSDRIQGLKGFI